MGAGAGVMVSCGYLPGCASPWLVFHALVPGCRDCCAPLPGSVHAAYPPPLPARPTDCAARLVHLHQPRQRRQAVSCAAGCCRERCLAVVLRSAASRLGRWHAPARRRQQLQEGPRAAANRRQLPSAALTPPLPRRLAARRGSPAAGRPRAPPGFGVWWPSATPTAHTSSSASSTSHTRTTMESGTKNTRGRRRWGLGRLKGTATCGEEVVAGSGCGAGCGRGAARGGAPHARCVLLL